MSPKLPVNNFNQIEDTCQFNPNFIKKCNEEINKIYFLEVDIQYLEKLHDLHNDLEFLPEIRKIENFEKLVANLPVKTACTIHIIILKQALSHGFLLKENLQNYVI